MSNKHTKLPTLDATPRQVPEATTRFFGELQTAIQAIPDYRRVYGLYNRVFQQCIDEQIVATRLIFSGTFAKTDYLLKEHQAPRQLILAINDTRSRLRKRMELTDDEMADYCLYDLKSICHFIAFICHTEIPQPLKELFPQKALTTHRRTLVDERIRVIVDHWDDTYVYVEADGGESQALKVCYADHNESNSYHQGDWSYLRDYFYKGAQMNLVRVRQENGIVYPELFILEPDYLVDISSIARCFTNYAESPFVNLVKRLEPGQVTTPILLGNFAGQLLDEAIHLLPATHTYKDSVTEFFKNNAIDLLTAAPDSQFHLEAQRQQHNIAEAIHSTLPSIVGHFDPGEGMVEPSFFSELLGVQGRMDYLQSDMKVLMEQKAGKGEWPYDNFVTPRYKEEHYVQLLLYMYLIRYNFHDIYEKNNRELHAFLLYSKYHDSLDGHGFAPELFFRALKIRNGIAWIDIQCTYLNGYRQLLDTLTPTALNTKKVNNKLWTDYQQPHIEALLAPIHQASELERAYYYRLLAFLANEHMMSKLGNKTKECSGFASKWHESLEDKLLAGNIFDRLSLLSPTPDSHGPIDEVELKFSETPDNDMANFRTGDIVVLYPYSPGLEPDIRTTMVFRCTIKDIRDDKIRLRLRAAQSDNRVFIKKEGMLWAIEHDFIESSYSSLYRGMHAFLSAPKERRDLILLQRSPRIDEHKTLKGDYGEAFNELALRVKRAKDLFLIIGPPGTGKTSFGLLNTVKEELLEPDSQVLLLSYTNRAVDEICQKLTSEQIDFIRIGSELSCSPQYRDKLLSQKVLTCDSIGQVRNVLDSTRVVVSTTTSLNAHLALLSLKEFSLAVIDEASQILEPHLLGILSAHSDDGTPAIRKIVMIGDHKQLPAVVQQTPEISGVDDPLLNDILLTDCRQSLFERLLRKYERDERITYLLHRQGRMHRDIALFPNVAFYNNQLDVVPLAHQEAVLPKAEKTINSIASLLATQRMAFIAVKEPKDDGLDKVNQAEADIIAAIVVKVYEMEQATFDVNTTIGVIVPYRNQIAAVRKTIDTYGIACLHDITIDTVERFQGSQRQYIIYGFTIQKYYQLSFLTSNVFIDTDGNIIDRKLNVAMTRAQEHLILVGNPDLLAYNITYVRLLQFIRDSHSYYHIDTDNNSTGNFRISEDTNIEPEH